MKNFYKKVVGAGIDLKFEIINEELLVQANKSNFDQVMVNLLINARDAIGNISGGMITIMVDYQQVNDIIINEHVTIAKGEYIRIGIIDNGATMQCLYHLQSHCNRVQIANAGLNHQCWNIK